MCRYVPDGESGGPKGAPDPYWKVKSPGGDWQRYNTRGMPITPEQAHPGTPPIAPPEIPLWLRVGAFVGGMLYSPPAN